MTLSRLYLWLPAALAAVAFLCIAYGYFIEPDRLVVVEDTITVNRLEPAFDGLRIVMIGDIHAGSNSIDEAKLRRIVELTNEHSPELVVMLGDYVSEATARDADGNRMLRMPIAVIAENLKGIRATYGVFAVMGNHDRWRMTPNIGDALKGIGYRVLDHEIATIERNGRPLRIFGMKDHLSLPDPWTVTSANAKRIVEASGDGDMIVLQHSPDMLGVISGMLSISPDLRLMLAAHTHGGQVRFPLIGAPIVPSNYGQKYLRGHIRENNVDMYVTSGIGTSILPFRFLVPPEIVVLTLRVG
ncbi:MAG: metallophosphoesterase [Chloracidobacterium sp.]|nr:metallophosphoesterase [Chloracidobacterium sp.]